MDEQERVPPAEEYSPRRFLAFQTRAGGIAGPLLSALLAFLAGGLVVALAGKNPLSVYRAIWEGTGLSWFFELPWDTGSTTAMNLQQTLLITTPIVLTGLAVAFAFRCGMFNIGGQGQYLVGAMVAVWVGSSFAGLPRPVHVLLTILCASLAGALYARLSWLRPVQLAPGSPSR